MNEFFEIVALSIPCPFILQDGSRFDLRTGIPNNALEVFKTGFEHLGLKPGAEKLFADEKAPALVELVRNAKRIEDLEVLALARPELETVKTAVQEKRAQFI